jgi:hypothetical protein
MSTNWLLEAGSEVSVPYRYIDHRPAWRRWPTPSYSGVAQKVLKGVGRSLKAQKLRSSRELPIHESLLEPTAHGCPEDPAPSSQRPP